MKCSAPAHYCNIPHRLGFWPISCQPGVFWRSFFFVCVNSGHFPLKSLHGCLSNTFTKKIWIHPLSALPFAWPLSFSLCSWLKKFSLKRSVWFHILSQTSQTDILKPPPHASTHYYTTSTFLHTPLHHLQTPLHTSTHHYTTSTPHYTTSTHHYTTSTNLHTPLHHLHSPPHASTHYYTTSTFLHTPPHPTTPPPNTTTHLHTPLHHLHTPLHTVPCWLSWCWDPCGAH